MSFTIFKKKTHLLRYGHDSLPYIIQLSAGSMSAPGCTRRTASCITRGYHPDRPIFKNLPFTVPSGKKITIVCRGKSTIFRLLYKFYNPATGKILIDGQDIHTTQTTSVRSAIGVVPQDTPLFHADIMHNIRYGRLDATDDEVKEAARKANVHATIERLPGGYETTVGERGLMISGGEKQRLAIARVLLEDPPILFFDEAVSLFNI